MGILRFSDGIEVDTSGPLRLLELHDGWYIVGEGRLIPVKDEEEGEQILYKLEFESMMTEFQHKIHTIVSSYPEEYQNIRLEFNYCIGNTVYDFIFFDEITCITGGFFIDDMNVFTNEQIRFLSTPFKSETLFLFDGENFISHLSNQLIDEFEEPWIFNETHYTPLHLLSDYFGLTTKTKFYVYTNEVEDFAKSFNIELEDYIVKVISELPNSQDLLRRLRSPLFKEEMLNRIMITNNDYFDRFYLEGMVMREDLDSDSTSFNCYVIPYSNIEVNEFRRVIRETIINWF